MKKDSVSAGDPVNIISKIASSVARNTVKFFRNIPSRVENYVKRKITDYKRKPKRDDVNKVYVLVGYTTKRHIESKYNAERSLIILNRGLLIIIFFLLLFISINAIIPYIRTDQYEEMFGISTVDDITRNDPFGNPGTTVTPSPVPNS